MACWASNEGLSGQRNQLKEDVFREDLPQTSAGDSGGRPGSKLCSGPRRLEKQVFWCRHP